MPNETKLIHVEVDKEDHKYFAIACKRAVLPIAHVIRNFVKYYGQQERDKKGS